MGKLRHGEEVQCAQGLTHTVIDYSNVHWKPPSLGGYKFVPDLIKRRTPPQTHTHTQAHIISKRI